jgi:hypothetical protein
MNTTLSDEQARALRKRPDGPVPVEDNQTHRVYVLVDQTTHERAMDALQQQEDIDAIQAGVDAAAAGHVALLEETDVRIREQLGFPPRA